MTLYRLPHGQHGYSGHVINLPHVASFANSLPCLPSDLDVIVVIIGTSLSEPHINNTAVHAIYGGGMTIIRTLQRLHGNLYMLIIIMSESTRVSDQIVCSCAVVSKVPHLEDQGSIESIVAKFQKG